jgi:hypothetical protein
MFEQLSSWLEKMGLPAGAFARIKGGRGVVGRTSHIAIAAMIVLGIAAARLTDQNMIFSIGIVAVALCLVALIWLPMWAARNPQLAVMEGLDLAAYKQAETAALGIPHPPHTKAIADPGVVDVTPKETEPRHG